MDTIKSLKPNIVSVLVIIKLDAIDSTNTYLKKLVQETVVEDHTVVVAKHQQMGRGQRGNGWFSTGGQSLTFSIFKRFNGLNVENHFMISMAVSLAMANSFKKIGAPQISIKWPNDILSGDKKIAGILIENVLEGKNVKHSIVGIGINVNVVEFPDLPQASSLKLVMGVSLELDEVFDKVCSAVFGYLQDTEFREFLELKEIYERNMFRRNVISVFEHPQLGTFNGIIKGISNMGELLVEMDNSIVQAFQLQELKLLY